MMKKVAMNNVMLDLETMGKSSDAAIVSIGACFFNPISGEIGESFECVIDLEDASHFGQIDGSTVLWWLKQESDARDKLQAVDAMGLAEALHYFRAFVLEHADEVDCVKVWGNGSSFDCVVLRNAYKHCIGENYIPWKFWNERDVRTVVDLGRSFKGINPKRDIPFKGVKHSALADAKHQAEYVSHILRALKS